MFQVAWIKSDSRAILAIHTHMVAHNSRLSVTHNGHNTWKLHVQNVQKNDSGTYMCQVNTDPMRSQVGAHLNLNNTVRPKLHMTLVLTFSILARILGFSEYMYGHYGQFATRITQFFYQFLSTYPYMYYVCKKYMVK